MKTRLLTYCGSALLALSAHGQESTRPNILFIMCDDMGYGDLGCYGQQLIRTPNLDQMAREGMRFTQAYCGSPVSAPSRCCLMTGQHSGHAAVRGNKEYWSGTVYYGNNREYAVTGQHPYDSAHVIIPEIFKDNGYHTAMFGKWAAGYEGSYYTPDKRGIDEYFGYICQYQAHLYFPNFLNRYSRRLGDKEVIRIPLDDNIAYPMYGENYGKRTQYSADIIHREAMEWLRRQSDDTPWLGIFTYTLPHAELQQPRDSILLSYEGELLPEKAYKGDGGSRYNANTNSHAQFAAMITRLDAQVGEIIALLREKGMLENTLVIFTSDNGPHEEGGADPTFFGRDGKLRGLKRSTYEGGIRIPFIALWPGHIPAGTTCDLPFAFYDLMPTFCEIAGIDNYIGRYHNPSPDYSEYFDGISIAPTLLGKDSQQARHPYLYWELAESNVMAVRKGDWKLVVRKGETELYNLATDIHEDHDVKEQHPELMKELIDIIYAEHVDNPYFKITLPERIVLSNP
ncbi:MAG: arylsulfatase [Bacteroidaceae bacterium]|nr:arylsulfatase [Bacteroidaceae bacterium]